MNYTVEVDEVDSAALLIALGYECRKFVIISCVDISYSEPMKLGKRAQYEFGDESKGCKKYGSADEVLAAHNLPLKGKTCNNVIERAKLAAHNYQVLKSVIMNNQPLQQIKGDGYTMLKNANGESVAQSHDTVGSSENLASIAIAAAMGCKVCSYSLENGRLVVVMDANKDGLTLGKIDQMLHNEDLVDEDNYNDLEVLVATFLNREQLIKGVFADKKVMLMRGSKTAIFSPDATESMKKRILEHLNA